MIVVLSNLFFDENSYWVLMDNKIIIFVLNQKKTLCTFKKTHAIKELLLINVQKLK